MLLFSSGVGQFQGKEPPRRVFANEIASFDCVLRTFEGKTAWYHVSFVADGNEVLLECEEAPDGTGFLRDSWLMSGPSFHEPKALRLPGLGYFSNPSLCQNKVAYWSGFEENSLKGVMVELESKRILAEEAFGVGSVETDFRFHFPPPLWKEGCKSVEFQIDDKNKKLVTDDG